MSYTRPIATPTNARSSDYAASIYATTADGTTLTCYTQDDLFSASIPAALGTTLLSTPVTLDSRFLGIHTKAADAYRFPGGWNRTHDMGPGGSNGVSSNAFRWGQHNPADGQFFDCGLGAWLNACRSAGQETVYTIFQTPKWISARSGTGNNPEGGANEGSDAYGEPGGKAEPTDMSKLAAFVTWLMTNYGSRIDYLELWNEPKYLYGQNSYFSGTASKLAEMARTIWIAAKAVKPSIKIMGPACTGVNNNGAGQGIDFTNQFLTASDNNAGTGKQWIDILSVHTYEHSTTNRLANMAVTKAYIDTLKTNNGISSVPVWSTEFGYITPAFNLYAGPSLARANALFRFALWNVAMGMTRANLYSYLNTDFFSDPVMVSEWNRIAALLSGATVARINQVGSSDQLACVINGQNYLV